MFDGHEDHEITLEVAAEFTARYRNQMPTSDLKGGFFGRDALEAILAQEHCVGIRYYYGLDGHDKQVLVLVGVLANENDMVNGLLGEAAVPCPQMCGLANELNS